MAAVGSTPKTVSKVDGRKVLVCCILLLVLMLLPLPPAFGQQTPQQTPSPIDTLPKEFFDLRETRSRLLREIPEWEKSLAELKAREDRLDVLSKDLDVARRILDQEIKANAPRERIDSLRQSIAAMEVELKHATAIKERITILERELALKRAKLNTVENQLNNLLSPELARQRFKQLMAINLSALVGLVILGFFWLALRDEKVRQAIFSGEAGIQFITLFSLVIAIILFGMTGILEGKELAALLGGLSGYILGRVTTAPTVPKAPGG